MNTTDERLRAAARAAHHMFPSDGDLPPLQLPEASHGGRRHKGPAGRAGSERTGRVRAWAAPLAAAAAVIAVVAALVVPHEIGTTAGNPKPARPSGPTAPAQSHKQLQQEQALDALIIKAVAPATGLQYDQGGQLIYEVRAKEQVASARCAAAAGYRISDTVAPYNLADFADNTQMPDLPRIARTHQFVGTGFVGGAGSYPAAEQRAVTRCFAAAQRADVPLINAISVINDAWWKIISRAEASKKVDAALPALQVCATRYGFPNIPYGPAVGPITSVGDFMDWVSNYLDGADSRGASASAMNALERHWTSVFLTCATPVVGIYQRALIEAQPGFLRAHAVQVARLDKLASQYLVQGRG
jgi:hypothetical protein